jgi:hypothetical protein
MKRILPTLVAVSLLAAPAAADAKELASATVCGASGCNQASHPAAFFAALEGGPPAAGGPSRPHPFYRLRVVVDEGRASEPMNLLAVPHGNYLRGPDGVWRQTSADVLDRITTLAGGLRPFPASQLPGTSNAPQRSRSDAAPPRPPSSVAAAQDGSFPWLAVGVATGAVLLASGLALALRRMKPARRGKGDPGSVGAPMS